MQVRARLSERIRAVLRTGFGYAVGNGVTVALGWAVVVLGVQFWLGPAASAVASVGALVATAPDRCAPRRDKWSQMLPAPLLSVPLFFVALCLHTHRLGLGLLIVGASFFTFLMMAWGKRGIPIAIGVALAVVFSLATRPPESFQQTLWMTGYFALGSVLYVIWAVLANLLFNARFRVQYSADLLLSLAALLRAQARQFNAVAASGDDSARPPSDTSSGAELLRAQAALADQLQATRDIVLESPRTVRRQQLAAMLIVVLEMRDHLLASELDLDALKADPASAEVLDALRTVLNELARAIDALADALLFMRRPAMPPDLRLRLAQIHLPQEERGGGQFGPTLAMLARGTANRISHLNDEVQRLCAIASGAQAPDLSVVRANWQMFVSPTAWSIAPFLNLWRWDAPALRHAIRAALALGTGYAIAIHLPWGAHPYWVLLTITVVLRGSLSQTLERRNQRVAGTLLGCVIALALLSIHPPALLLLACMMVAQGISQAFAIRRYLYTAVAATVVGLVQAHMLSGDSSPTFALFERIADTLLGTGIAWAFCYVLPSWERTLIPGLITRVLKAQARHARLALGLGPLRAVEISPELDWRLARREAYDSLSALVQATQRALSEPRAVRPPIEALEYLQAHGYQLLAQLSAVKAMLVLRHDRLDPGEIEDPLQRATVAIESALAVPIDSIHADDDVPDGVPILTSGGPVLLPDPFNADISPWLVRRLDFAVRLARQLRHDATRARGTA